MNENNDEAYDEEYEEYKASILSRAVAEWRKERDRLNDMIAVATGEAQQAQGEAVAKPDMFWEADEPEDGVYGNGAEDFAENYASNCLMAGDTAEVKVLCATRAHTRRMEISVSKAEDAKDWLSWRWLDAPLTVPQPDAAVAQGLTRQVRATLNLIANSFDNCKGSAATMQELARDCLRDVDAAILARSGQPAMTDAETRQFRATVEESQPVGEAVDIAKFDELIDAYQCAQKDGTFDERVQARATLKNAYRAALQQAAPSVAQAGLSDAARDVLAERQRQITAEGWTPEHDDEHAEGQLSYAAAGYALSASDQIQCVTKKLDDSTLDDDGIPSTTFPHGWKFKAAPPRRMLVKAGALIQAEIERLDRAAARSGQPAQEGRDNG